MNDINNILEIDEITDIIELEEDEVLDIEIDSRERCFFANDILTHNSGYDSTDITMENIAESAGLSHTADMMYAIIQDRIMYETDPPEYWLKILKIRDGEGKNRRFKLTINYEYMRLTETEDEWNRNNDE
jgi:hypothetical protein